MTKGKDKPEEAAPGTSMAIAGNTLPAHLQGMKGKGRGNENVTTEDTVVPRVDICQSLSPQRDRAHAKFIPGIEEGVLFNSLTGQMYGRELFFVPVLFTRQYLVWKDRKKGGGFRGAYKTLEEAQTYIESQDASERQDLEPVETAMHLVLVPSSTQQGKFDLCALSMARTKLKVSKQLNSLIRMVGGDRFARVYSLSGVQEKNGQGQTYYNFSVKSIGYANADIYKHAEAVYNDISINGRTYTADQSDGGSETDPDDKDL